MKFLLSILMPAGIYFLALLLITGLILAWSIWIGTMVMRYTDFSQFEASLLAMIGSFGSFSIIGHFLSNIIDLASLFEEDDDDED